MRDRRDFEADFERSRRRFRIMWRLTMAVIVIAWTAIIAASAWLLLHPEAIGSWVGRLMGGARG